MAAEFRRFPCSLLVTPGRCILVGRVAVSAFWCVLCRWRVGCGGRARTPQMAEITRGPYKQHVLRHLKAKLANLTRFLNNDSDLDHPASQCPRSLQLADLKVLKKQVRVHVKASWRRQPAPPSRHHPSLPFSAAFQTRDCGGGGCVIDRSCPGRGEGRDGQALHVRPALRGGLRAAAERGAPLPLPHRLGAGAERSGQLSQICIDLSNSTRNF